MASEAEGYIIVPVWSDGGVVKPLINDNGELPTILDPTTSDTFTRLQGWDLTNWRKLPLLWGYTDNLLETDANPTAPAGTNILSCGPAGSGYVWVVHTACALDATNNPTRISIEITSGGTRYRIIQVSGPGANVSVNVEGHFIVKAGDSIQARFTGVVLNDAISFWVTGYKMKVNE